MTTATTAALTAEHAAALIEGIEAAFGEHAAASGQERDGPAVRARPRVRGTEPIGSAGSAPGKAFGETPDAAPADAGEQSPPPDAGRGQRPRNAWRLATPSDALRKFEPFLFAADGRPLVALRFEPVEAADGRYYRQVTVLHGECSPVVMIAPPCGHGCGCACHGPGEAWRACTGCRTPGGERRERDSFGVFCADRSHGPRGYQWEPPYGIPFARVMAKALVHAGYERDGDGEPRGTESRRSAREARGFARPDGEWRLASQPRGEFFRNLLAARVEEVRELAARGGRSGRAAVALPAGAARRRRNADTMFRAARFRAEQAAAAARGAARGQE